MEKIKVNTSDLRVFLEKLSEYGKETGNPYLVDASQTLLHNFLFEDVKEDFSRFTNNQITFNN